MKRIIALSIMIIGFLLLGTKSEAQNWFPSDINWITEHNYVSYPDENSFAYSVFDNDTLTYAKCNSFPGDTFYIEFEFENYKYIDYLKYKYKHSKFVTTNFYYLDSNDNWINVYSVYSNINEDATKTINIKDVTGIIPTLKWRYEIIMQPGNPMVMFKTYDITFSEDITININELEKSNIKIYPNPVTDIVNIEKDGRNILYLYDISGRMILEKQFENKESLNISYLPTGLYIYRIDNIKGKIIKK